ncbi:hypothetical protein FB567DRAFT_603617 [Paraphoma chrysanthemicola]|uniref:Uncharacterized protein n=1 Tax=Paraphoma chrysanthemicola TaxID=798071 RepID=A0A8K0VXD7_9PLEO|nr:hypothetical protein FB567DRAFT_603617 [Paraphoma chrysanthemicola]
MTRTGAISLLSPTIILFASNSYHGTMTKIPPVDPTATSLPLDKSLSQLLSTLDMTQPTSKALAVFVESMVAHFDARISCIERAPKTCISSDPVKLDADSKAQLDRSMQCSRERVADIEHELETKRVAFEAEQSTMMRALTRMHEEVLKHVSIDEGNRQKQDRQIEDLEMRVNAINRSLLEQGQQDETLEEEDVQDEDPLHREIEELRRKINSTHQLAHGGISDLQQMLRGGLVGLEDKLKDDSTQLQKQQIDLSRANKLLQVQKAELEAKMAKITSRMAELMNKNDIQAEKWANLMMGLEEQEKIAKNIKRRLTNLEASMDAAATTATVRRTKKPRTNPEVEEEVCKTIQPRTQTKDSDVL